MSALRIRTRAAVALAVLALTGTAALTATAAVASAAAPPPVPPAAAEGAQEHEQGQPGALGKPTATAPETAPGAAPEAASGQAPATPAAPVAPGAPGQAPAAPQAAPAAEPTGRVVSRLPLAVRQRPTAHSTYLGSVQPGAIIPLSCKVVGEDVDGNSLWYRLGDGRPGYVAARYVHNLAPVPYCR
ncbi:SH3 domain-containing protein [Streptomyces sp. NPDC093085]|uniref:SH3 domain-containing protein n=1 Tax=Streptomyces sp. NPDC093085 TaxID=3155068 RepID=UPI0034457FC7